MNQVKVTQFNDEAVARQDDCVTRHNAAIARNLDNISRKQILRSHLHPLGSLVPYNSDSGQMFQGNPLQFSIMLNERVKTSLAQLGNLNTNHATLIRNTIW